MSFLIQITGVLGMAIVLLNLFLLETGREKARSRMYLSFGLTGSLILVYYSFVTGSILFTILNFVFVGVNAYWLFTLFEKHPRRLKRRKR